MSNPGMNERAVRKGMELRLDLAMDGVDGGFPPNLTNVTLRGVSYTKDELKKKLASAQQPWKD